MALEATIFELSLRELTPESMAAAARSYGENGWLALRDVEHEVVPRFEAVLDEVLSELGFELGAVLDGSVPLSAFDEEQRQTLSQIDSDADLQAWLVRVLEPVLLRLMGPVVHVSRNFHAQFKGGDLAAPTVDHGGYPTGTTYMEPFGQYLLHQDFTGANLPTSPSFITLWVPLTTGPHWGLRLYPGSHTRGILCNDWIELDDERLEMLGEPIDFPAERGRALLFQGLLMHSTTNPGESRRVSCDVRFFPLCGFLPTVPWILGPDPVADLEPVAGDDETLRCPRLETQAHLGRRPDLGDVDEQSVLNWVGYVERRVAGDDDGALAYLERFTNPALTGESWEVYRDKYHHFELHAETRERARRALASDADEHPRQAL